MEGINIAHRWRRLFAFAIDNLMIVTCVFAITVHGGKVEGNRRVIYGNRLGRDLVFDFIRPFNPNGLGIIFINSGSWKSDPDDVNLFFFRSLLRRGYSIFTVSHLSQPKANVPQIFIDIVQGIKFIRQHASEYGVAPNRLGVTGASRRTSELTISNSRTRIQRGFKESSRGGGCRLFPSNGFAEFGGIN